jgi:hypothetical protein
MSVTREYKNRRRGIIRKYYYITYNKAYPFVVISPKTEDKPKEWSPGGERECIPDVPPYGRDVIYISK